MGQRLVVVFQSEGETIAVAYYHWDAYTTLAIRKAKKLADLIKENGDSPLIDSIIKAVAKCGGGLADENELGEARNIAQADTPLHISPDKRMGLLALTEDNIETMFYYAEGTIYLDLDEQMAEICVSHFSGTWKEVTREMAREWEMNMREIKKENAPRLTRSFESCPIEQMDEFADEIDAACKSEGYRMTYGILIDADGVCYTPILF